MYTGTADHSLTAELVDARRRAGDRVRRRHLAREGAGRARDDRRRRGDGRPRRAGQPVGAARDPRRRRRPSRRARRSPPSCILFIRETVRELGERRASGFLKKFYGWYLGRGRFPRPFKQELVVLDSTDEVVTRLLAAAPGAAEVLERLEAELPSSATTCCSTCRSRSTAAADGDAGEPARTPPSSSSTSRPTSSARQHDRDAVVPTDRDARREGARAERPGRLGAAPRGRRRARQRRAGSSSPSSSRPTPSRSSRRPTATRSRTRGSMPSRDPRRRRLSSPVSRPTRASARRCTARSSVATTRCSSATPTPPRTRPRGARRRPTW